MANSAGKDLYGTYGGTPSTGQDITAPAYRTQASAADFGGQVGQALEHSGDQAQDISNKYMQMATEAKVNDDFANKYAPAAAQLRQNFDSLRGQDKIAGYDGYISGLQKLNQQFVGSAPNPVYGNLMGSLLNRHVSNEIDGAKRELVAAQKQYSDQATYDMVKNNAGYAAQNYNNPQIVNEMAASNDAHVALRNINDGLDPRDPAHAEAIETEQREVKGKMAAGMIHAAVSKGDINSAQKIRDSYSAVIPGFQQLEIDKTLHAQSMVQASTYGIQAFKEGKPLPQTVGSPPFHVQAVVADSSTRAGLDPNIALTVARIETSMGQNVGTRGTLGQTANNGGDLQQQSDDMVSNIIESKDHASKALGREPEPWEIYTVYQQGAGGGPALLKAATENPSASAIDVLTPLYKSPRDARSAIINNGGNATMTSGDFLGFLKQKYNDNAARAASTLPEDQSVTQEAPTGEEATTEVQDPRSLGQAIIDSHTQAGPVVQKGASPLQNLMNFDEKAGDIIARIQAIPNDEVRKGVMEAFNRDREQYQAASNAYTNSVISQAHQLAADPKFTDIKQMSPDMFAVATDRPAIMNYMQKSAEENLERASGTATKDMKEYGGGMFGAMRDIADGKITNNLQLMDLLPKSDGTGGQITIAGYEKLKNLLSKDPESQADVAMQTQAFKVIKRQLSGEDTDLGIKDPKGEELYSQALPKLFKAIDEGKRKGLTMGELTDPSNPSWIGNTVQSLKRSAVQQSIDMTHKEAVGGAKQRTAFDILQEYQKTADPAKKKALQQEAVDLGYIPKQTDRVEAPISQ